MNDNMKMHQILTAEELLESKDIIRMDWPVYALGLNSIEMGCFWKTHFKIIISTREHATTETDAH